MVDNKFELDKTQSYDYMIDMKIRSLTIENANKLQSLHDSKLIELEAIKAISAKQMWFNDLKTLSNAYRESLTVEVVETKVKVSKAKRSKK